MRGRTVAVLSVAASVGLIAFILVQISSIGRQGVAVGVRQAVACTATDDQECLPDISMEDVEGNTWDRGSMAGQVVIVNFWATWCRPCLVEIPDLAEVHDRYRDADLVLLGIMTDRPSEGDLAEFTARTGLNYPVVRADADILHAFGPPDVLPTTLVYDRGGKLVMHHQGLVTAEQMSELVDELLAHEPPGSLGEPAPDAP
jgi:thiol-disulfide isomerase/thioredoxin